MSELDDTLRKPPPAQAAGALETSPTPASALTPHEIDNDRTGSLPAPGSGGAREPARGAQFGGRYVILDCVGRGAMGVVFAAYDPKLDRKVALKLLKIEAGERAQEEHRARMLREAQAMARVSHPNVCAVFDVGAWDRQVFVAMEFIDGPTLAQWLKQQKRSWEEALEVFLAAGRGLAAAHAVGLVHRDFKPSNVLLSKGGRACVTDFGLARQVDTSEPEQAAHAAPQSLSSGSLLAMDLTQTGAMVGTPAYMPPEQYLGEPADARSDQFSYCAALYEALYGKQPFEPLQVARAAAALSGAGRSAGAGAALEGIIQEPPADSKVPAWLKAAVLRGLALEPAQRFASMEALLAALARRPNRARRLWTLVAAGTALAGVAVAGQVWRQSQVCAGAERLMEDVWNPQVQRKLESTFASTGAAPAAESARLVSQALNDYARHWVRQRTEACKATRVRGEQTEELLSLKQVCLERGRKDLQAVTRLFTEKVDAGVLMQAMEAAYTLPTLEDCQNIESLATLAPRPADPARRTEIEEVEAKLSEVEALSEAGRYGEALRIAQQLEPRAVATGWRPVQAEVRLRHGELLEKVGQLEAGTRQLELALEDAESGRAERLRVQTLNKLIWFYGVQGHYRLAELCARLARAALARLGEDPLLASESWHNLGLAAMRVGRLQEALGSLEKALVLQRKVLKPKDPQLARTIFHLGQTALQLGEHARAVELLEQSLLQSREALGSSHPNVANRHLALSWALREARRLDDALAHAHKGLEIRRALYGEQAPLVADSLDAVGMSLIQLGRHEEARQTFMATLKMRTQALGPEHEDLYYSYDGVGQALLAAGRVAEAVEPLEKALSFNKTEPMTLAETGMALARAYQRLGYREQAREAALRAREHFEQAGISKRAAEVDAWLAAQPSSR